MTPEDRTEVPESPQPPAEAHNIRRRLLRGGLAASPALLTLVNRPAMAATCKTASSHLSASLSRPGSGRFNCTGRKPASWASLALASWPGGENGAPKTKFKDAVGQSSLFADFKLPELLASESNDASLSLAKHLAAAHLNAVAGLTPAAVLDVLKVKDIWAKVVVSPNYYEPTAGIRWTRDQVIAWVQTTMPT